MTLNKHMMALAAASALFVGGSHFAPVKAADLGGDCCADLEERVAELEATTARKGNKKVSLTISGQVNRGILAWDDGKQSDAYVVDGDFVEESRIRFEGKATLKPGWSAGFVIEVGIEDTNATFVSQKDDEGGNDTGIATRLANVYIESERLGRVTIGQQNSAADGITVIHTDNAFSDAVPWYNLSFGIRSKSNNNDGFTGLKWGDIAWGLEGFKGDFIRYDSPSIYGFILSAAWGENDTWDIALRYAKEWNSIRIAAGIGYQWIGDRDRGAPGQLDDNLSLYPNKSEIVSGSISAMHVPTGLFVNFAAGHIDVDNKSNPFINPEAPDSGDMWLVQAGIEKRWLPYGATTVYGEYGKYNDIFLGLDNGGSLNNGGSLTGSEATRWGVGLVQRFDSAALDLYAVYQHWEADIDTTNGGLATEDMNLGIVGARIKF